MGLREDYDRIMGKAWASAPAEFKAGEIPRNQAATAVRRIWKKHTGRKLKLPLHFTSGNRNTWGRDGKLYVNAEAGWFNLNHDLSHFIAFRIGIRKPHCGKHLEIEREGALWIIQRFLPGWTPPEPKPEKPKVKRRTWKVVAAEYDIELDDSLCDPSVGHYSVGVFPPDPFCDTDLDPFYGDHYAHDRVEARSRVLTYVELINQRRETML